VNRRHAAVRGLVFVPSDGLEQLVDLGLLLSDDLLEARNRLACVLGRDTATAAVVAALAGGDEIVFRPEKMRRLRAWH
jgi:hypothetical protein